jgi:predicted nucleotidyltransferase
MTSLIRSQSEFHLTQDRLKTILVEIKSKLGSRVETAYVFGSAATGEITQDSDIDLILVVKESKIPFVQRGFEFLDLFEAYPRLDILVYTPEELSSQLADSSLGFWKSARESMKPL